MILDTGNFLATSTLKQLLVVVIINIGMFTIFIGHTPKIQKHIKNERNDIIIFAKLSALTGFCWIFGFVYRWTDIQLFSYLFIIFNASQGLFIFFLRN